MVANRMQAHLVIYSSLFPTSLEPDRSIFTAQLAEALSNNYRVSVVCPIPWCPNITGLRDFGPCRPYASLPRQESRGAVEVYYPRYPLVPNCPQIFQPWLQRLAISRFLQKLHHQRRIDAVNAHWVYPDGVAAVWMAKNLGIPTLLTALGSDVNVSGEFLLRRRQLSRALTTVESASGVSRALTERLIALGSPASRTHYIPNGINKKLFAPVSLGEKEILCRELGLNPSRKYLIFVGRLHPVKGLTHLVDALSYLLNHDRLDFDTLLVGSGELESILKASIRERGLERFVRLVGNVPHSNVRDWLRIGEAFCLPSLMEGMPNVVLEALACGLPVVASRVGALPDMVNSESGILVSAGTTLALAQALSEVMTRRWDRTQIACDAAGPDWSTVADMYSVVIASMIDEKACGSL
ncbi:MAG: glycosyltransferase [Usitatibacteraceae bacterium]